MSERPQPFQWLVEAHSLVVLTVIMVWQREAVGGVGRQR